MTPGTRFLIKWTLAVAASVGAFVLHLGLRGTTMQRGYELGRARAEQDRLREVARVLEVEAASYQTPQRVEVLARTLLGMQPPTPDRIVTLSGPAVPAPAAAAASAEPPAPQAGRAGGP